MLDGSYIWVRKAPQIPHKIGTTMYQGMNSVLHGFRIFLRLLLLIWHANPIHSRPGCFQQFGSSVMSSLSVAWQTALISLISPQHFPVSLWGDEAFDKHDVTHRSPDEDFIEYISWTPGFPGVIGCIDGCHPDIPFRGRAQDRSSFINRKRFSSIVLQCICNVNMSFIDAYAGWPGSVHDSRVFRNSPITAELEKLPPNLHILGDSAYPLSNSLITPFREVGNLKEEETRYNIIHSSTSSVIDWAFAFLKGKFGRQWT